MIRTLAFFAFTLLAFSGLSAQHKALPVIIKNAGKPSSNSRNSVAEIVRDSVVFSDPEILQSFSNKFGTESFVGVFFTIPDSLYPIQLKAFVATFYGGSSDTVGPLAPAEIQAAAWFGATEPTAITAESELIRSSTSNVGPEIEQVVTQTFEFNNSPEIATPTSLAVGVFYASSDTTFNAASPVFGPPAAQ